MKTNLSDSGAIPSNNQKRRGAALVLVLAFLVLITALVISFFTSVTNELSGAKQYAGGATAQQLADSAVQTVIGTIKLATSGTDSVGSPAAWASQPGMIRTYDSTGNRLASYKLYSSDNMVDLTGTFNPADDCDVTSANSRWSTSPALYTDLNSPVVTSGTAVFPILDGNNLYDGYNLSPKVPYNNPARATYLTYYTNRYRIPDMEGFYVAKPPNYVVGSAPTATNNPVPMPTKWIYVLRDGTLTVPDAGNTTTATFPAGKRPTSTNPIVGRIAFWTDDDTSKVNINTASAGANTVTDASGVRTPAPYPGGYWNTPTTKSTEDQSFATRQPMNKEYQRYPGHPATTSLKPVFSKMWYSVNAKTINDQIYQITPRVSGGGSDGGAAITGTAIDTVPVMSPDADRLYASVDELMFTPTGSGSTRDTQVLSLSKTQLAQGRFFITVNSRAPDVNLFNKPRVCIWPISALAGSGTTYRSTFDNVFAFCSTSGSNATSGTGNAYYFQRSNSDSGYSDLPTVASLTGTGRNRMLIEYLHDLTSKPIPGFGGNFQAKYYTKTSGSYTIEKGTECDQILTEMFDYVRCTNLSDKGVTTPFTSNSGQYNQMRQGQVVPIVDRARGTRGLGRFPTIDKAFFMFIRNAQNPPEKALGASGTDVSLVASGTYNVTERPAGVLPDRARVQVGFFMNFFCAAHGYTFIYPKFKVEVKTLNDFTFGPASSSTSATLATGTTGATTPCTIITEAKSFGFNGNYDSSPWYSGMAKQVGTNLVAFGPDHTYLYPNENFPGGNMGFQTEILTMGWCDPGTDPRTVGYLPDFPTGQPGNKPYNSVKPYPFVAATSTSTSGVTVTTSDLPKTNGVLNFSGGTIAYKIYNAAGTELVQTGTLNFPGSGSGWPVPELPPATTLADGAIQDGYNNSGNFRYFVTGSTQYITGTSTGYPSGKPIWLNGGRLCSAQNGQYQNAWILGCDVVRSMEIASGDPRLASARATVSTDTFSKHVYYDTSKKMAHSMRSSKNFCYAGATYGRLVNGLKLYRPDKTENTESSADNHYGPVAYDWGTHLSIVPQTGDGVMVGGTSNIPGDWDNGYGDSADGPYINKADEGDSGCYGWGTDIPYYESGATSFGFLQTLFSPNRQIPSAVMFGSLPTGVFSDSPWQTLLFRPLPLGHPGLGISSGGTGDAGPPYSIPPDHLFLDLFNMPVVEPYPISEPLSTAGRINMNYQIAPFTHINRDTGIRAVLDSERIIAIANGQSATYKGGSMPSATFPINIDETLRGFTTRFKQNDLFRSASEICSIHLVPQDTTDANAVYDKMAAYWTSHKLTGDNSRERPYATIYPRLTTKSNTYTVHFRVQTLKKVKATNAATWVEGTDLVTSEYRGSQTIERYVDASDPTIPDYADPAKFNIADPIDKFYKFRVLSTKKFAP